MRKQSMALLLVLFLIAGIIPAHATAAPAHKLAAITFDDGPGPYTDKLLDELAKRDVVVTFFMQGYRAAQYPAVVKRAYEAGHQIASHTYDHPLLTKLSGEAIQEQISATASVLNRATGGNNSYMVRPPYGSTNARVLSALNAPAILWSVDTLDWESLNAGAVCRNIINDTKDGSIVLLHDIHPTSIPGALRGIDALLDEGYELVTVSELLRRRGCDAVPGTKYFHAPGATTLPGISQPAITPTETERGRLVTLSADAGATIYYTTDGTSPTSQSTVYTGPFLLEDAATVKAIAVLNLNGGRSRISKRTLDAAQAKAPIITLENGLAVISAKGEIRYTLDGTLPAANSEPYTGPVPLPNDTMIRAIAIQPGYRDSRASSLLHSSLGNLFSDVQPSEPYYQDIDRAVSLRLMATENRAFYPSRAVTRQELAAILYRLDGEPDTFSSSSIPDVAASNPDYAALMWAANQHILTSFEDGMFRPNASITREELAVAFYRLWAEIPDSEPAPSKLYAFQDWKNIHIQAWEAVDWAVSSGLLQGISNTALAPSGIVTRAQLASMILRAQALREGSQTLCS